MKIPNVFQAQNVHFYATERITASQYEHLKIYTFQTIMFENIENPIGNRPPQKNIH